MSEYIIKCTLYLNGKPIANAQSTTEKEIEVYRQINLMNSTGFGKVTPRYGVTIHDVVPCGKNPIDWKNVRNATLVIIDDDKTSTTYRGVYVLKVGEKSRDGEKEVVQAIDLGATDRIEG